MKNEETAWKKKGVFICTKCGSAIKDSQGNFVPQLGENLKNEWKKKTKELGVADQVRIMNSSCLGICQEGSQALCVARRGEAPEIVVFDPFKEANAVLEKILREE